MTTDTETIASECTICFIDLIGSVRLYQREGDAQGFARVSAALDAVRAVVEQCGGTISKHMGDGLMVCFAHPDRAAEAAMLVHEVLYAQGVDLGVCIGFHHGPVIVRGNDLFGDTVNCASRLQEMATEGRAIMTEGTARRLSARWQEYLTLVPRHSLRGAAASHALQDLCELRCAYLGELTQFDVQYREERLRPLHLVLRLGLRRWVLDESLPVLRLGRQASLDVCVADPRVSRLHAEIELRGNQFVLVDHSSNGTFVTPEAGEEFQVSHGQMVLPRSGWLSLGTCAVTGATVLRFEQRLLTQVAKRPRMVG